MTIEVDNSSQSLAVRDLKSLLRKTIGKDVEIISEKTTSLLGKGENYNSTVLKIDVTIKRKNDSEQENLQLVAKTIPSKHDNVNSSASFIKEIFFFKKLLPTYRKWEEALTGNSKNLIDILPKFYGGRMTLKDVPNEADDDAVLVMENLNISGYQMLNRHKGMHN